MPGHQPSVPATSAVDPGAARAPDRDPGPDRDPDRVPGPGAAADAGPGPGAARARTVLADADLDRALTRIAHELLERGPSVDDLVLLGIPTRGVPLARRLARAVEAVEGRAPDVGSLDVTMYRDDLRRQPTRTLERTDVPGDVTGRTVVLVDDVLYSGRTIRAALDALADVGRPRAVRLVVLVDRGHRELPIRADHVGRNLPTSRTERVRVRLAETDGSDGVDILQPAAGPSGQPATGPATGATTSSTEARA